MDKRYQVFISSTYEDLREERSKVMTALLELDCIPSGMELFPAADEDAWSLIQRVIDECDYYLLILAGRFGSVDDSGMGYTEKEYRYALDKGKPILAFIHATPELLPAGKCEREPVLQEKLKAFRDLASRKLRKPWSNPDELASVVSRSMVQQIKVKPGIGWIRADQVPAPDVLTEAIRLQKRVRDLEAQLAETSVGPPVGSELLKQGEDTVELTSVRYFPGVNGKLQAEQLTLKATWNRVLKGIAKELLASPLESEVSRHLAKNVLLDPELNSSNSILMVNCELTRETCELLRIQFRALGLVRQEFERQDAKDSPRFVWPGYSDYRWFLTEYGDRWVTQMLALRRE